MLQKEVADRIASGPGTKDYGTRSVWCHLHGTIGEKVRFRRKLFSQTPNALATDSED